MNANLVRRACAAFLFVLLSSSLLAQTITVPASAAAGSDISVQYHNPGLAGQQVVILVQGGVPSVTREIPITLDANGKGSATWTVPTGWTLASFDGPAGEQAETDVR
jgi:hypothetical protein